MILNRLGKDLPEGMLPCRVELLFVRAVCERLLFPRHWGSLARAAHHLSCSQVQQLIAPLGTGVAGVLPNCCALRSCLREAQCEEHLLAAGQLVADLLCLNRQLCRPPRFRVGGTASLCLYPRVFRPRAQKTVLGQEAPGFATMPEKLLLQCLTRGVTAPLVLPPTRKSFSGLSALSTLCSSSWPYPPVSIPRVQ